MRRRGKESDGAQLCSIMKNLSLALFLLIFFSSSSSSFLWSCALFKPYSPCFLTLVEIHGYGSKPIYCWNISSKIFMDYMLRKRRKKIASQNVRFLCVKLWNELSK